PETWKQGPKQDFVGFAERSRQQIRYVVVARGGQWRAREYVGRDAVLLEEGSVQRALDDDRALGGFRELHDAIRVRCLGRSQRESAAEADQVVGVLGDVVFEPVLAQRAGRELGIEWHCANDVVDAGIALPGGLRKGVHPSDPR